MSESIMWLRCEKCGNWCQAEKKGFFGRIERTFKRKEEISDGIGDLFDFIGMKNEVRLLAKPIELTAKIKDSALEAIVGDEYKFHCSCGWEKGLKDDSLDHTIDYMLCLEIKELFKQYKSIHSFSVKETENYLDQISTLLTKIQDNSYLKDYNSSLYVLFAAVSYFKLHNSCKALTAINKSIELCPDDPNSIALRGVFRTEIQKPIDRYTKLQDIIKYKESQKDSLFLSRSEFQTEFNNAATKYAEDFLQIPKERRKFLIIDDELRLLPNSFLVLTPDLLSNLGESGLEFPNGYASEKSLYICHPYKVNKYLDAENYKDELFYDQLDELKELLQCLGAKRIDMTDLHTHETTTDRHLGVNAEVGGAKGGISANVGGEYTSNLNYYEKKKKELFQHLEYPFVANVEPHIWSNSVWFPHLTQWQSIARSRLRENGETRFNIYLSTYEEKLIKENEQLKLKADFDAMIAKGNLKGAKSLSFEHQESKGHEWNISVEFYPLSDYEKKEISMATPLANNILPAPNTSTPLKKFNIIWAMAAAIIFLIGVILYLLFF